MAEITAAERRATVAHVLRRATFAAHPDTIEFWADKPTTELLEWVIEAKPMAIEPGSQPTKDDWEPLHRGWLNRMRDPQGGLHEKLVWFWHDHLPVSSDKAGDPRVLWTYQRRLRDNAFGGFRTLLRELTTDAAVLAFLDGAGSTAQDPNENYARELMELYTMGRGNYSEDDVRAGARALAGWWVDNDKNYQVNFSAEDALWTGEEVTFLGRSGRLGVDDVIDAVTRHEATAPFIAGKLWEYFVGTPPDDSTRKDLAGRFSGSDLSIKGLAADILRSEAFLKSRRSRPRYPIEWYIGAVVATDPAQEIEPWYLEMLGQQPYKPPSVAGWPAGRRWLGAEQVLARAAVVGSLNLAWEPNGRDPIPEVLRRCGIHDASPATQSAMAKAARATEEWAWPVTLFTTALCSPEFVLA
jgi:uncharacterized protein (DUF1800 family)